MRNPRVSSAFAPQAVLFLIAVAVVGCVTADAVLKADGSGTLDYTYNVAPEATATTEKAAFSSPNLTLESFSIGSDRVATLKATFTDATKLNTASGFKNVAVTRSKEGDAEKLAIVITNPSPKADWKEDGKPGPKISITLPGKVNSATGPKAEFKDNRVTWSMSLAEFVHSAKHEMSVTYAAEAAKPDADAGKAGGAPAAAKPADAKSGGAAKPK